MFVRIRKRQLKHWNDTSLEVSLISNRRQGPMFKQDCKYLGCIRLSGFKTENRVIAFWRKVRGTFDGLNLPEVTRKSIEKKILVHVPMPEEMRQAKKYKVPRGFKEKMKLTSKRPKQKG